MPTERLFLWRFFEPYVMVSNPSFLGQACAKSVSALSPLFARCSFYTALEWTFFDERDDT